MAQNRMGRHGYRDTVTGIRLQRRALVQYTFDISLEVRPEQARQVAVYKLPVIEEEFRQYSHVPGSELAQEPARKLVRRQRLPLQRDQSQFVKQIDSGQHHRDCDLRLAIPRAEISVAEQR